MVSNIEGIGVTSPNIMNITTLAVSTLIKLMN
jgi:hypothetical protein